MNITITNPATGETETRSATTREEYLRERNEWRNQYRELSRSIRESKLAFKAAQRESKGLHEQAVLHRTIRVLRNMATEMLAERRIAKLVAQASYEAHCEARLAA